MNLIPEIKTEKISFGGIPNSRNVLFLQFFLKRAAKPRAGNTSAGFPLVKWPQILLNLTWLCTNLLRNLPRNLVEPDMALHQSLPDLHRNLLRNPVEHDLALPQSLLDLLRNLLRNLLQNLLRNLLRNPVEPDLALHQTFSGTVSNQTWLCFSGTFFRNLLRHPIEPGLAPHQSLPDLLRNLLRNHLRNLLHEPC